MTRVTDPTIAKISNHLEDYPSVLSVVEKLHTGEKAKEKYNSTNLRNRYPNYFALDALIESLDKPLRKHSRHATLFQTSLRIKLNYYTVLKYKEINYEER